MRIVLFFIYSSVLLFSCQKDVVSPNENSATSNYPSSITVGDSTLANLNFFRFQPSMLVDGYNQYDSLNIDLKGDGTDDVSILAIRTYPFAGTVFGGSNVRAKALHDSCYLLCDIMNEPMALNSSDTLFINDNWITGDFYISYTTPDMLPTPTTYNYGGNWFGQVDKYLGVKVGAQKLGWINMNVPVSDSSAAQAARVFRYGCVQ